MTKVDLAIGTTEKCALYDRVLREGGEGVVAKRLTSKYEPGKPTSLVSQAKFKFTESSTYIVEKINGDKRSVSLMLLDDAHTLITKQPKPGADSLAVRNVRIGHCLHMLVLLTNSPYICGRSADYRRTLFTVAAGMPTIFFTGSTNEVAALANSGLNKSMPSSE